MKLEIKEFLDKPNRLYVAVALEGIKKDRVESMGVPNIRSHVRTSPVNISISDLLQKINPKDVDFLKYIPNELLTDEQIKAKTNLNAQGTVLCVAIFKQNGLSIRQICRLTGISFGIVRKKFD